LIQKRIQNSFLLFFIALVCNAQTSIIGVVQDEQGKMLSGATVIVSNIGKSNALAYAISKEKGNFKITLTNTADSLKVSASYLGFTKQVKKVLNTSQVLKFVLEESTEQLKEIVVKSEAIRKKGDTLSYSVSSFKSKNDRVIADVLSKMPGIEVLQDGRILYQGKAIQKYYIEGLDLLEGRYNLANNNLPASAVSKVQILENHQPIKLLDSLVFSDKTSLNIKLKSGITRSGTATLALGESPLLWNANITPMFFAKKKQLIGSYQANNIGNDIGNELKILTVDDLLNNFLVSNDTDYLNIVASPKPSLKKNKWLVNNAHIFSLNYLSKPHNTSYKTSVSYLNDYQQERYIKYTNFYTLLDTIAMTENLVNKKYLNTFKAAFVIEKNESTNFVKNSFHIKSIWNTNQSFLSKENETIPQLKTKKTIQLSNKLKWIQKWHKQLITIQSNTLYRYKPEGLTVYKGVFNTLINNGMTYQKINQQVAVNTLNTSNSLSFTKKIKQLVLTSKIGFLIENKKLTSTMRRTVNTIETVLNSNFLNDISINTFNPYFNMNVSLKKENWSFSLNSPLTYRYISKNTNSINNDNFSRLNFDPKFVARNKINAFWKWNIGFGFKHKYGEINKRFDHYILKNYSTIQRFSTPLEQQKTQTIFTNLQYRNPLKNLFISTSYTSTKKNTNLVYKTIINTDATSLIGFITYNNTRNSNSFNMRLSKYISKYNSMLATTFVTVQDKGIQLLNNNIVNYFNTNIQLKTSLDVDITADLSFSFTINHTSSITQLADLEKHYSHLNSYKIQADYFPIKNHYFGLSTELYQTIKSTDYFLNLSYHYKDKKRKIDYSLDWHNIFNHAVYSSISSDTFYNIRTSYFIRPAQLVASIRFNF